MESIRAGKQQASGTIKIGIWLAQATHYLPEIIQSFSANFGDVGFEVKIGTNDDQVRWLAENVIDMAFVSKAPADRSYSSQQIYAQPLLPVASAEFFKKYARPKNIRHTLSLPLIDFPNEFSAFQSWIRMNSRADLLDARKKAPVAIVENSLIAKELISRGLGFGFLHRELIEAELAAGELERIEVREEKRAGVEGRGQTLPFAPRPQEGRGQEGRGQTLPFAPRPQDEDVRARGKV